jgi:hypothetical protein
MTDTGLPWRIAGRIIRPELRLRLSRDVMTDPDLTPSKEYAHVC